MPMERAKNPKENASKQENDTTVAELAIIARDCTNDKRS